MSRLVAEKKRVFVQSFWDLTNLREAPNRLGSNLGTDISVDTQILQLYSFSKVTTMKI